MLRFPIPMPVAILALIGWGSPGLLWAQDAAAPGSSPQLVKATYSGEFNGDAIVNGTGEWTIAQTEIVPVVMPLPDINIAMQALTINKGEANVGERGGVFGLLIEEKGPQTCKFRWSAGGVRGTEAAQFDLRLPPCPVCALDLLIPADHHVTENSGKALLIGPLPAATPKLRRWQIHSSGVNQVLLSIAKTTELGSGPVVLAQLRSTQHLQPLSLDAVFDFRIEILHHALEKLTFVLPADLEPFDVTLPDHELKNWQVVPAPGKPEKLLVATFARPVRGLIKSLQIRCLGTLPLKGSWTSPGIDLRDSALRGEVLDLILHPDVQLENWQPGNFQLRESRSIANQGIVGDPRLPTDAKHKERVHALKLAFSGGDRASSKRPGGNLKTHEPRYFVQEQLRWEIRPQTLVLHSILNVQPVRGRLFQLAISVLPVGKNNWRVQNVQVEPPQLMHDWTVAGSQLLINFRRALGEKNGAKITIALEADLKDVPRGGRILDFPDVLPVGNAVRFGSFGILVDPAYHADVLQTSLNPAALPDDDSAPMPQYYFAFRAQQVSGKLRIAPQQTRLRVDTQTRVALAPSSGPRMTWSAALEPLTGNPEAVIFFACPLPEGGLTAETNAGTDVPLDPLPDFTALLPLGSRHGIERLVVRQCVPRCEWWRIAFSEPLEKRETIHLQPRRPAVPLAAQAASTAVRMMACAGQTFPQGLAVFAWPMHDGRGKSSLDVPQLRFVGTDRLRSQTTVLTQGVELTAVRRSGLDEVLPDDDTLSSGDIPHTYRALPDALPRLQLSWQNRPGLHAAERFADFGILRTFVEPRGPLRHHFRFGIWDWPETEVTVELPKSTHEILSVKADDCWITSFTRTTTPDGVRLRLPLGRSNERHVFDIEYSTDDASGAPLLWGTLQATVPKLPTVPLSIRHIWRLPSGLMPLLPSNYVCQAPLEPGFVSLPDVWSAFDRRVRTVQPDAVDWEFLPGDSVNDLFVVINTASVNMLSAALGVFLFLNAWAFRTSFTPRWQFRLLSFWLIAAVLGVVWLPASLAMAAWSMGTAGLLLASLWLLRSVFAASPPRTRSPHIPLSGAGAVLIALTCGSFAHAGEIQVGALDEAMIVRASYKGQVDGLSAEFVAQYRIRSFADQSVLILPLAGVDLLEGARLDDAPVYPLVSPKAKGVYRVSIPTKGIHELHIAFRVRIPPALDAQSLQFGVPKTADNQLELIVPESFREIVAVRSLGMQSVAVLPDKTQLLSAELGPANLAHVRWRQRNSGGGANVLVRENYFWDLQLPEASLVAILDYQIKSGHVTDLLIELPEDLDVRSVKTGEAATAGPPIEEWKILTNKGRRLRVQFAQPLVGDVRLHIEFVPRLTSSNDVLLRLPYPMRVKEKDVLEGHLAYRLPEGVQAQETRQNLGVLKLPASAIPWQAAFPRQQGGPTNAYRFGRRPTNAAANAALQLSLVYPRPRISEELTWRIHPDYADLSFVCRINPTKDQDANLPAADVMLLEVDTPKEFTLAEVKGADVLYWTRVNNQTQIWLQTTDTESEVTMFGWVKHPLRLLPGKVGRYALPHVRVRVSESPGRQIAIEPVQGVALEPLADHAMAKLAGGNSLLAAGILRSAPVRPDVAMLTTATLDETKNREIVAQLDFRIPFGTFRPLTLLIKNWPAGSLRFETPDGVRLQHLDSSNGDHTYRVQIGPEVARRFQLTVKSQQVLERGDFMMPHLQIVEANRAQSWLAILGDDLQVQEATNLQTLAEFGASLALWPQMAAKLERSGTAWHTANANWTLRLAARRQPETSLRVVCAERLAGVADKAWLHGARLVFFGTQRHAEIHLPAGSTVSALLIDGRRVTPHFQADNELRLHFPDVSLVHDAQIWWRSADETLTEPKFQLPHIVGENAVSWIATLDLPDGYQIISAEGKAAVYDDVSFALLSKAEAFAEFTRALLANELGGPRTSFALAEAQDQLRQLHGQIEERARALADTKPELAKRVSQSVSALRKRNLEQLQRHALERLIPVAAGQVAEVDFETIWGGTPVRILNPDSAPKIKLVPLAAVAHEQRLFASEFAVVALIGLLLLSLLPSVFAERLRGFWPEQLLLLAGIGWLLTGPSFLVALAAALAVLGRIVLLLILLNPRRPRGILITPGSSFRT